MFWAAVGNGLDVLTFWQTYVAGLEFLIVLLVPMMAVGVAMQKGSGFLGCLSMFVMPAVQVAAMAIFILTLSPIILGIGKQAAWALPWMVIGQAPVSFLKLIGLLYLAALVMAFVPILGRLQAINSLVTGSIALAFVLEILRASFPQIENANIELIPSFWFVIGLLVVGGAMTWISVWSGSLVLAILSQKSEGMQGIASILAFAMGGVFGFIPVFIYGAWLGSQIRIA